VKNIKITKCKRERDGRVYNVEKKHYIFNDGNHQIVEIEEA
jgi:hypothetical protein